MSADPRELVDGFAGRRVLVVGDAILDRYLHCDSERLCREGPVPVLTVSRRVDVPGGAANAAVNLAALGAKVRLVAVVGDDPDGALLIETLERHGVDTSTVAVAPSRQTTVKQRMLGGSQLLLRLDQVSRGRLETAVGERVCEHLRAAAAEADCLLVSDYDEGTMIPGVVGALRTLQRRSPRLLVVDARRLESYREVGPTVVTPNYEEARTLLGTGGAPEVEDRVEQMLAGGQRLRSLLGAEVAVVTLDRDGSLAFTAGAPPHRTYARSASRGRSTGAGDAYVSALTLALAAGGEVAAAVELAAAAASVVVGGEGTGVCSREELLRAIASTRDKLALPR